MIVVALVLQRICICDVDEVNGKSFDWSAASNSRYCNASMDLHIRVCWFWLLRLRHAVHKHGGEVTCSLHCYPKIFWIYHASLYHDVYLSIRLPAIANDVDRRNLRICSLEKWRCISTEDGFE